MKKYLKILKNCPLFWNIEESSLLVMLNCLGARIETFDKKYTVMAEGSPAHYIGIVLSGSVHAVDEVAYDIIAMFENSDRDAVIAAMEAKYADREDVTQQDIAECYDDVVALKERGKLFAPDTFEPMAGKLKEKTAGVVKAP